MQRDPIKQLSTVEYCLHTTQSFFVQASPATNLILRPLLPHHLRRNAGTAMRALTPAATLASPSWTLRTHYNLTLPVYAYPYKARYVFVIPAVLLLVEILLETKLCTSRWCFYPENSKKLARRQRREFWTVWTLRIALLFKALFVAAAIATYFLCIYGAINLTSEAFYLGSKCSSVVNDTVPRPKPISL
eukprot:Mrub_04097.p1 GENE.Mrub_04097~~Mrub_04097.p1  ORF type:complete len:189 (-),score=3.00 Mrub_04097:379-945(-)